MKLLLLATVLALALPAQASHRRPEPCAQVQPGPARWLVDLLRRLTEILRHPAHP